MRETCTNCDILAETVMKIFEHVDPEHARDRALQSIAEYQPKVNDVCKLRNCERTILPRVESNT